MPSGEDKFEQDARGKRDRKQQELKKLLDTAHSKFQNMHKDKISMMDDNQALKNRIQDLERELMKIKSLGDEEAIKRNVAAEMRDAAVSYTNLTPPTILRVFRSGSCSTLKQKQKKITQINR